MPKKLTEEQKLAQFQTWQQGDEFAKINQFALSARSSIVPIEMATQDIVDYWDTFLNELYELMSVLKIPGRKVKSK
jgi:hypothetical protein